MINFIRTIIFFCMFGIISLQPVPDIVRVRTVEDAKGAEFYALDMIGLVEQWGYPVEQHNITTNDGYILNIFRIPSSPKSPISTTKKPVIFLLGGAASSSDIWFAAVNRSLPFVLADVGYDVWIGNYRGSTYGKKHIKFTKNDANFWDYSFQELGVYDLPSSIDYILNLTNEHSLTYLGHSLGGTTVIIMLSERPEYNDKINLVITFAPVIYSIKKSLIRQGLILIGHVTKLIDPNGTSDFFPQNSGVIGFYKRICIPNGLVKLCKVFSDMLVGEDDSQYDEKWSPNLFNYFPSGMSTKLGQQYRQSLETGLFRQYDYENDDLNIQHYGSTKPPDYNVANIKSPMIIFYSKNDPFLDIIELRYFISKISSKALVETIRYKNFNHVDYILAKDVQKLVYDRVVKRLLQFQKKQIPFLQTNNSVEFVNDRR